MFLYCLKRLLIFIPTLLVITLVTFGLSRSVPGDPVECHLPLSDLAEYSSANKLNFEKEYLRSAQQLYLDRPTFYFAFTAAAYPDTLYRIVDKQRRKCLSSLIAQYGNWPLIEAYYQTIRRLDFQLADLPDSLNNDALIEVKRSIGQLLIQNKAFERTLLLRNMERALANDQTLSDAIGSNAREILQRHQQMVTETNQRALSTPTLYWYGTNNQYHAWVTNFFIGNFGNSCRDGRPVFQKIMGALFWTVILNLLSFIVSFMLAVPIGVAAAQKPDSWFDRFTTLSLFMLYAMPIFWIATLAVIFLTSPEYHLHIFPSVGLGRTTLETSAWQTFWTRASHLVLPVICLSYNNLAFISRQVRGKMIEVLSSDYIRTAKAKGLSSRLVVWRHAFRNALFPLITILATLLPASIAGSLVIELIFNIPGMGLLIIQSIGDQDWNIVFAILILSAILTMLGNLIADILYAWADPRVTYTTSS